MGDEVDGEVGAAISRGSSERYFTRTARSVHPKNNLTGGPVFRGGIRL